MHLCLPFSTTTFYFSPLGFSMQTDAGEVMGLLRSVPQDAFVNNSVQVRDVNRNSLGTAPPAALSSEETGEVGLSRKASKMLVGLFKRPKSKNDKEGGLSSEGNEEEIESNPYPPPVLRNFPSKSILSKTSSFRRVHDEDDFPANPQDVPVSSAPCRVVTIRTPTSIEIPGAMRRHLSSNNVKQINIYFNKGGQPVGNSGTEAEVGSSGATDTMAQPEVETKREEGGEEMESDSSLDVVLDDICLDDTVRESSVGSTDEPPKADMKRLSTPEPADPDAAGSPRAEKKEKSSSEKVKEEETSTPPQACRESDETDKSGDKLEDTTREAGENYFDDINIFIDSEDTSDGFIRAFLEDALGNHTSPKMQTSSGMAVTTDKNNYYVKFNKTAETPRSTAPTTSSTERETFSSRPVENIASNNSAKYNFNSLEASFELNSLCMNGGSSPPPANLATPRGPKATPRNIVQDEKKGDQNRQTPKIPCVKIPSVPPVRERPPSQQGKRTVPALEEKDMSTDALTAFTGAMATPRHLSVGGSSDSAKQVVEVLKVKDKTEPTPTPATVSGSGDSTKKFHVVKKSASYDNLDNILMYNSDTENNSLRRSVDSMVGAAAPQEIKVESPVKPVESHEKVNKEAVSDTTPAVVEDVEEEQPVKISISNPSAKRPPARPTENNADSEKERLPSIEVPKTHTISESSGRSSRSVEEEHTKTSVVLPTVTTHQSNEAPVSLNSSVASLRTADPQSLDQTQRPTANTKDTLQKSASLTLEPPKDTIPLDSGKPVPRQRRKKKNPMSLSISHPFVDQAAAQLELGNPSPLSKEVHHTPNTNSLRCSLDEARSSATPNASVSNIAPTDPCAAGDVPRRPHSSCLPATGASRIAPSPPRVKEGPRNTNRPTASPRHVTTKGTQGKALPSKPPSSPPPQTSKTPTPPATTRDDHHTSPRARKDILHFENVKVVVSDEEAEDENGDAETDTKVHVNDYGKFAIETGERYQATASQTRGNRNEGASDSTPHSVRDSLVSKRATFYNSLSKR
ncbi:Mucin 68D [Angomonas deanei]|uniref:Uncharacterized protein n=1 Tax=Angomonas deanei TaxID=59799 RepID=A0A7G2C2X0_9TRYP|nr:Mucin 68D [Angomonas deanei]CAD2213594.1 hypothetical protein, conserved [Angomonas deanei]|eukprot:EPY17486.1 Mucin 68D [Angomonas deanei]